MKSMVHALVVPSVVTGCALLALSGCGGGSSSPAPAAPPQTYSLSGTVTGLTSSGLVLTVNSTQVPVSSGSSSVALASGLASGAAFSVTVQTQPTGETCSVASGVGAISSANFSNVVVTCSDQAYALGGSISGLNGSGLVLANGSDALPVNAGATSFTLPTSVAYTASYDVVVQTQPAGLTCSVSNGMGVMPASAFNSISVSCTDQPFTLSGTIIGLGNNTGLVIANGSDSRNVPAGSTQFMLSQPVAFGTNYSVGVTSNPAGLTCSVAGGSQTMEAANVTNIVVTCSDVSFALAGSVTGLTQSGLVISNGADSVSVPAGASSYALHAVAFSSHYDVEIQTQPTGETCSISQLSSGSMPAAAVSIAVQCSVNTYTISGTVTGLSLTGLVLLNNGSDATPISPAGTSQSFSMTTGVAYGANWQITVGTQPYGIRLACTPSANSGTITGDVSGVIITCAAATPVQKQIASSFNQPAGVAVDAAGDVFVADTGDNAVEEIRYSGGVYGAPVTIGSGFINPSSVAVDSSGNVFVDDYGNNAIKEIPYSGGVYGTTVTVASGFNQPTSIALDAAGDLFVADSGNYAVDELVLSGGGYGAPIPLGSGYNEPYGVALDAQGDLFVSDTNNNVVDELVLSGGSYASPVVVATGFMQPTGLSVDSSGNLYVADFADNAITQVPLSSGTYGTPVVLLSGLNQPTDVAVDASGNLYIADTGASAVMQSQAPPPMFGGSYSQPTPIGSGFNNAWGMAVDAAGDVFVADTGNNAIKEIPFSAGQYGAPIILASGLAAPYGVAVDASGNVFFSEFNANDVQEIAAGGGLPVVIATAGLLNAPIGLAVDAADNVYVANYDGGNVLEVPYSSGSYGTPVAIGSGFSFLFGVAVDATGNVFVADTYHDAITEIPLVAGSFGAPVVINANFGYTFSVAVDALGNLFLTDDNDQVYEIPYSSGAYGTPVVLTTTSGQASAVSVDGHGRLYAFDRQQLTMFAP